MFRDSFQHAHAQHANAISTRSSSNYVGYVLLRLQQSNLPRLCCKGT